MKILVVGSLALDDVETPYGKKENSPGGSALYFSGAASLFAPVNVVGVVGNDFNFNELDFLKSRGVNFDGLKVATGKTFRWGGKYHADWNRRDTLFTELNVFENFQPEIPQQYRESEFVFLANIDPVLQLKVLDQMKNPKLVILDTMNFWISGKRLKLMEVISRTNILILNDEETKELTREPNLISAGKKVLEMGPEYLVIKKGEHGAILMGKNIYFYAPAFPLENIVDPTGAGDSFAGGFVGYLAKNGKINENKMRKAVIYGSAVASFNVQDFSFKKLIEIKEEQLRERLEQFYNITRY